MKKIVEAKDKVNIRYALSPKFNPKQPFLSYVIQEVDKQNNSYKSWIMLVSENDLTKKKRLTNGRQDKLPKWSPSGKYLAFIRPIDKKPQLHVIAPFDGGEAIQVTDLPNGIIDYEWLPEENGFILIAPLSGEDIEKINKKPQPPDPLLEPVEFAAWKTKEEQKKQLKNDPRVINRTRYRVETYYVEDKFSMLVLLNASIPKLFSEEIPKHKPKVIVLTKPKRDYSSVTISKDGKTIYSITRPFEEELYYDPDLSVKIEVIKIDITTGNETSITILGGWPSSIKLSPDEKRLALIATEPDDPVLSSHSLWVIDLEDNSQEKITTDYSYGGFLWESEDILLALKPIHGKIELVKINIHDKKEETIFSDEYNIYSFDTKNNKYVLEVSSWARGPGEILLVNEKHNFSVTNVNDEFLKDLKIPEIKEFWVKNQGYDLQAWVAFPPDKNGKSPVCLEMHGGPAVMWSPHEKTMWHEFFTLLYAGYAVVFTNPRGSEGYGNQFKRANYEDWGHGPGSDVIAVLKHALNNYSDKLDKNKVVVTGGSYAGYLTAWLVTHDDENLFKAAVAQRGVYDIPTFYFTTDIPTWAEKYYGGTLWEKHEKYWLESPSTHIKNLNCPLMILHSENDFRVPIPTAEALFFAGKRHGKNVVLVRYPREGHELSRSGEPRHIIDRLEKIIGWFNTHLE